MQNIISIDLEDWFCTYNLCRTIDKNTWDSYEQRIQLSANRLLSILKEFNVRATFFVLVWIAERNPDLIERIEDNGHEIALHGYDHRLLTSMTKEEFNFDIEKSLNILHKCNIKGEILGYRAPSFTIIPKTLWAFDILEKYNFKYDSSIFPTAFHTDYGFSGSPLEPYKINDNLYEFPLSCLRLMGINLPFGGGAYFRILPYFYNKNCMKKINSQNRAAIFYLHPWEIDPGQPRIELNLLKYLRQYYNLNQTEKKLRKLLSEFEFITIKEFFGF